MNELLTSEQMAQADAGAVAQGVPAIDLMARAGQAVGEAIVQRFTPAPVLVLCGPGNNGGDGYVVACLLAEAGWPVTVVALRSPESLQGEARYHAVRWLRCHAERADWGLLPSPAVHAWSDASALANRHANAALVVDALFGAGLRRRLLPEVSDVLETLSARGLPIVAVDLPSGLHADTGQNLGAVEAQLTVTFFRKKPGHVLMPGQQLCGEVVVADIGIDTGALDPSTIQTWENTPGLWWPQWSPPAAAGHKYRRGHTLVFGGARMVGASRLTARAAARLGSGLTTLSVPAAVWPVYAATALSGMVQPLADQDAPALVTEWRAGLATWRWSALAVGPGAMSGLPGDDAAATLRDLVEAALASPGTQPVVLDADALMAYEAQPEMLFRLIADSAHAAVLTPHEGEFERLWGGATHPHDKLARTRDAARRAGAVVLHKGADTVIAAPDGRAVVNTGAPPWLATAGSGDVLAGFIAGLLAQGMPAFEAACMAAWVHGACGRAFGPGLIADDLPEQVPEVLKSLMAPGVHPGS